MTSSQDSPAFRAHVLEWLKTGGWPQAVSVESVTGDGVDGDISASFDGANFTVDIVWTDNGGNQHVHLVDGSGVQSLWQWVVGGFHRPAPRA